jgi:hypothetical protein
MILNFFKNSMKIYYGNKVKRNTINVNKFLNFFIVYKIDIFFNKNAYNIDQIL